MEVLGNVLGGVKELYDKTNKANLSGAIDVVVVKQVIARTRYHETSVTLLALYPFVCTLLSRECTFDQMQHS